MLHVPQISRLAAMFRDDTLAPTGAISESVEAALRPKHEAGLAAAMEVEEAPPFTVQEVRRKCSAQRLQLHCRPVCPLLLSAYAGQAQEQVRHLRCPDRLPGALSMQLLEGVAAAEEQQGWGSSGLQQSEQLEADAARACSRSTAPDCSTLLEYVCSGEAGSSRQGRVLQHRSQSGGISVSALGTEGALAEFIRE